MSYITDANSEKQEFFEETTSVTVSDPNGHLEEMRNLINVAQKLFEDTENFSENRAEKYDDRHGGPYDRGRADSYYRRPFDPHYFLGNTYSTPMVPKEKMTSEEVAAYTAGYNDNEAAGDFKDWG